MTYNTISVNPSNDPAAPDVAIDRIGGSDFQRVKIQWGAEGTANDTEDTAAKQFPVGGSALGIITESAPASDTSSSGLNGRLQRIAQRLTSIIALLPAALGQGTMAQGLRVVLPSDQSAIPVTNDAAQNTLIGAVTESAPASDTASSGLNGRLQRIAQRLTSVIALLPAALGQGTMAQSLRVVLPSDQSSVPVTPSTATAISLTHTTATATNATAAILASNGSRKYALIINDGSVDVYLKVNASAVANQGIRLLANGGSYEMSNAFGNLDTRAINGIVVAGSAVVLVAEG